MYDKWRARKIFLGSLIFLGQLNYLHCGQIITHKRLFREIEEEQLFGEILTILEHSYVSNVNILALYLSGYYDTSRIYEKIIIELGLDILQIAKLLAWYVPKMIQNPRLSRKIKIKRCLFIMGATAVIILLFKEWSERNSQKVMRSPRFGSTVSYDMAVDIQPRPRPQWYTVADD